MSRDERPPRRNSDPARNHLGELVASLNEVLRRNLCESHDHSRRLALVGELAHLRDIGFALAEDTERAHHAATNSGMVGSESRRVRVGNLVVQLDKAHGLAAKIFDFDENALARNPRLASGLRRVINRELGRALTIATAMTPGLVETRPPTYGPSFPLVAGPASPVVEEEEGPVEQSGGEMDQSGSGGISREPARSATRVVSWAVDILPRPHRSRYEEEYFAELYDLAASGLSPHQQLWHALRIASRVLPLRSAMEEPAPHERAT